MIQTQRLKILLPTKTILLYFLFIICYLFSIPHPLSAIDFNIRPRGFVYLPSDNVKSAGGNAMYSMGGGGDIGFEIDLSSVWSNPAGIGYTLGVEGGMLFNGIQGEGDKSVSIYSAGRRGAVLLPAFAALCKN